MSDPEFNEETALDAALALEKVLAQRTHRKTLMGQTVVIPGQLGGALKIHQMIQQLRGKTTKRRASGLTAFDALWPTLSAATQKRVLDAIGWYDPKSLDWEDKRSNRIPVIDD